MPKREPFVSVLVAAPHSRRGIPPFRPVSRVERAPRNEPLPLVELAETSTTECAIIIS